MTFTDITDTSRCSPLTQSQVDIWLEQSIHPDSTQYVIAVYYRIPVRIDVSKFIAATNWVFSQYEALYGRLSAGPQGLPNVQFDPRHAVTCRHVDLSGETDAEGALQSLMRQQAGIPFEMLNSSLANPHLIELREDSFCYFCTHHHILIDGWGVALVFCRIAEAYEDLCQGRTPKSVGGSYSDYLAQGEVARDPNALQKAREFWRAQMTPQFPSLPPLHACSAGMNELSTSSKTIELPREFAERITERVAEHNATLFHAFLLAYCYAMRKQYSLEVASISVPIPNRSKKHRETIGCFVESRTTLLPMDDEASVVQNLRAIGRHVRDVYRHYELPGREIDDLYKEKRRAGRPAENCSVSYITRDFGGEIGGVPIEMINVPEVHARSPLVLYIFDAPRVPEIRIKLVHQLRYLSDDEARLFLHRIPYLLEELSRAPEKKLGELGLVPAAELGQIQSLLRCAAPCPQVVRPIIEDILERGSQCPDAVAVECGDTQHSYRECIELAYAIVQDLTTHHRVQPGDRIGLLLPRSVHLVASYLGVMLAGAVFVPFDPEYPPLRLLQLCNDARPKSIITTMALTGKLSDTSVPLLVIEQLQRTDRTFASQAQLDAGAYVIYTSGSTGKPKGVQISQRALAEHVASWSLSVPLRQGEERQLLFHSPAFDATIECIFPALVQGNTIVAAPHPQWPVDEIAQVIVRKHLTVLYLPPAYLLEFVKYASARPRCLDGHEVRFCVSGGEAMYGGIAPLWDGAFGPNARLLNAYGPTEVTVTATLFEIPLGYSAEGAESIPIGRAHAGRMLRIVDATDQDVPLGAEGELLIGGIGLADGYLNKPEETAAKFTGSNDGLRYYRSGDTVKLKADGRLVFCGRRDRQVKIRGFRIEPGEIETCLLKSPAVRECAVVPCRGGGDNEWELRAFVAIFPTSGATVPWLHQYLSARLPHYMVPMITVLDSLPKGIAGKIDHRALMALHGRASLTPSNPAATPPRGVVQEYLAVLWGQALGTAVHDAQADFFELGGHSLLAARLATNIGKAFRLEYSMSTFFEHRTIAATARALERLVANQVKLEKMATVRLELLRMSPQELKQRLQVTKQQNA